MPLIFFFSPGCRYFLFQSVCQVICTAGGREPAWFPFVTVLLFFREGNLCKSGRHELFAGILPLIRSQAFYARAGLLAGHTEIDGRAELKVKRTV